MTSLLLLALTAAPSAAPPATAPRPQPLSSRAIYDHAVRGTVYVSVSRGFGTGWILDAKQGLIVTNYHVANEGTCTVYFPILDNGKVVSEPRRYFLKGVRAKVIDSDPKIDLTVLEADSVPDFVRPLPLAGEAPSPGDRLHLVGNPGVSAGVFVYTTGTLRQTTQNRFVLGKTTQQVELRTLEMQMGTNPGDSGSAVLNDCGEVVGVNFAGPSGGKVDSNGEYRVINSFALAVALEEVRLFVKDVNDLRDGRASAAAHERLAGRLARKGRTEQALAELKRSIELEPGRASAYLQRATLNYSRRHHDAALLDAGTALELDPHNAEAANLRGNAHSARRDHRRAIRDYNLAVRIQPTNAVYRTNRGMSYSDVRNDQAALTDFTEAIRLSPGYAPAYRERGAAYHRRRDYGKAIADFEAGARLAPGDSLMLHWLADARLKNNEFAAAADVFGRALKLNGRDALLWRGLGDARFALAQYDLAADAYGWAVRNNPKDAVAHYRRGRALEEAGDVEGAQADFAKAIELSPALERELKTFSARQVKVANTTGEALTVFVRYEDATKGPEGGVRWTVAAGSTVTLHYAGKPIEARKMRIWAEGAKSGRKFDVLKRRDVVLADRPYRAKQIDAHVHRFGE